MASPVDICNRALGEIGARTNVNAFTDPTPAAQACQLYYDSMRQMLLRTAPWNFARKQVNLSLLKDATSGTCPFPWMFEYLYPSDCLKFRYMLQMPNGWPFTAGATTPPQTGDTPLFPYYATSRRGRFLVSTDVDSNNIPRKVLLTNLPSPIGVYSFDCTDVNMFDSSFSEALVAVLAEKFVMPLTGNAGMKGTFIQIAKDRVIEARAADGNEDLPTTDINVDWLDVRGVPNAYGYWGQTGFGPGITCESWDSLSWGS